MAVGLILGAAGIGNASGPLIGGFLTEFASWRWVLFVNMPLALTAGILTYLVVDKQPAEIGKKTDDYTGVAMISISLVLLMYALNQSTAWGWGL
ncbi:MAG: MFS transporter, partial [Thermodesulfobacteriota bacterium]